MFKRLARRYTSDASIFQLLENVIKLTQNQVLKKSYQFHVGASAKPKKSDLPIIPLAIPPYISVQVGEDSFFSRYDAMGVADGVGGWSEVKGANPALYSLKMMHYARIELEKYDNFLDDDIPIDYDQVTPKDILIKSYQQVNQDAKKEAIVGSTTALICLLRDEELRITNIGDCGLMLIREGEPVFRNEEQQHSFNFPFQLGTSSRDQPKDAQSFNVKVKEGDILVLGTDGLFDNVFDEDIIQIVNENCNKNVVFSEPQRIADALLKKAREVAEDNRYATSPFQERFRG